ncbi:MAG: amidase [Lentilitoribacter sp.]
MQFDATALADAIRSHKLTASEAMSASLAKLKDNKFLGSVVAAYPDKGLLSAKNIDLGLQDGPVKDNAVFCGVPTLAKDLGGPFKGFPVCAGSGVVPTDDGLDSELAMRFRAAGLCCFGTTTSPEFGLSLASEPLIGPICRNPLNPNLSAGGSSGGAASAVASGIVSIAHATDAGGSIRVPAACCGLVGLKPSRGAIPSGPQFTNYLGGIASELAVCRSVRDTANIFHAISGGVKGPYPMGQSVQFQERKLRVAMLLETGVQYPTDPERLEAVQAAGQSLEADGHEIVPLNWTQIECMAQECAQIFAAIIATNLADLEQSTDWDFSKSEPITQAAIEQGKLISGVELWRLMNRMVLVSRDLWQLFEGFDCLLTPMLSTAPKSIGSFASDHCDIDLHFDRMTAFSPLATLANVSGFPAITMPFGEDANGLPLPIQFLAPMGCEKLLLSLAARMETELRWQHKFPIAGLDR